MIIKNIDLPEEITKFIIPFKTFSKKRLPELMQFPFIKSIANQYDLNPKDISWHFTHDIPFSEHICPICGKHLHVTSSFKLPLTCSPSCSAKLSRPKLEKTCLERYGAVNVSKVQSIQEKKRQTCLEKYGTVSPTQSELVKAKTKKTNLERYGFECSSKNPKVKKQIADTLKRKTGYSYPFLNPNCRSKAELNRKKTRLHDSFINLISNAKEFHIEPLFTEEEFTGSSYEKLYRWRCLKCGKEFEHWFNSAKIPKCPYCRIKYSSVFECEICKFIEEALPNMNIQHNTRSVINPYELDIYISSLKLAIEFNGDYWHSEEVGKTPTYHLNKTKLCEEKGIHLIHIFEYQWIKNKNQVKSRLCSLLNIYDKKIFARKCIVREIDSKTTVSFLEDNHLQGSCPSKVNLGLFYNNELISVMTFGKPRFNKDYQWELLRFCSLPKFKVIGGAGKLLKFFEQTYNPKSLISYANRCWSSKLSNVYEKIGFKLIGESKPSYVWIKDSHLYSRYQCQKHKLKDLLGEDNFDKNLSEVENMKNNRFLRVYDCGNLVFCKIYN